jgi:hypothetical protein
VGGGKGKGWSADENVGGLEEEIYFVAVARSGHDVVYCVKISVTTTDVKTQ